MTVRAAWLLPTGQTREDTRLAPLGTMAPETAMTSRDGVIAGGSALNATGAGMQVQIATGRALVQGTAAQGAYPVAVTSPETLTVADGNAQFTRIDSVVLRVLDGLYDTSEQTLARVELVQGDATATPTAPTLPPACLRLWDVTVPAGASAGTGGLTWASALADRRRYTASYGGIIPRGWGLSFAGAYVGQYRDNGTGLDRWDGTAWQALEPSVGWTAVTLASGYTNNGNAQGPVRYRRIDIAGVPHMQWRGGVSWATSGTPPNNAYPLAAAVPAAARPANLVSVPIAAGGVDIKADFQTGGLLRLIPSTGLTVWASLTGVQYPLDA
ncbi:hypothetical protein N4G70_17225 [Streptomyces sp. ASQP_92]|uniref:hypothetical protein n=1 Tax=Streptomyces sp. ASQP_92 TaxID=2979116 RepID=UPI0021BEF5FB|nr:hypothetical protein [Streptomyces sp. ASQP_92]MCT9090584.1 hypothetical protein [Streptomyces sp. ASQP_92]